MRTFMLLCINLLMTSPSSGDSWRYPSVKPIILAKNSTGKKRINISRTFREGMENFEQEKYREAAALFSRILKEYPGHEPSRIQLAKTLYRMGKGQESYDVFKGLNPKYFDPETAYEYAHAFFAKAQYEGALMAFKKIPKGHALYDLASFYGAISAFKLERYQEADDLMENAVVLPSKLIKSRALYKKSISEILLQKQKEELNRQKTDAIAKLKEETKSHEEALQKKQVDEEKANARPVLPPPPPPPPMPQPYGFFSSRTRADAGIAMVQQSVEYKASPTTDDSFTDTIFNFGKGAVAPFLRKPSEAGGDYLYQIDLMVGDHKYSGPTWMMFPSVEEEIDERFYQSLTGKGDVKIGSAAATLGLEAPLSHGLWYGTRMKWRQFFPELETGKSSADAQGEFFLGQKLPESDWQISGQFHQILDKGTDARYNVTVERLTTNYLHDTSGLGLRLDFQGRQYVYQLEPTDGPETSYLARGTVYALFPFSTELGIEGLGRWDESVRRYDIGNLNAMIFDRDRLTGRLYAQVSPFPWLTLQVAGIRQSQNLAKVEPRDVDARTALDADQYQFMTQTTFSVFANLLF